LLLVPRHPIPFSIGSAASVSGLVFFLDDSLQKLL
jgi:hypothetical protein